MAAGAIVQANDSDDTLTRAQLISVLVTFAAAIFLSVLSAYAGHRGWVLCLAASVGGLGGLLHEIAQSGGKIVFFERKADGFYLGSLAGMVLGAVAGVLTVRAFLLDPTLISNMTEIAYEALLAGMALKGVAEAAGGQTTSDATDPAHPDQH